MKLYEPSTFRMFYFNKSELTTTWYARSFDRDSKLSSEKHSMILDKDISKCSGEIFQSKERQTNDAQHNDIPDVWGQKILQIECKNNRWFTKRKKQTRSGLLVIV